MPEPLATQVAPTGTEVIDMLITVMDRKLAIRRSRLLSILSVAVAGILLAKAGYGIVTMAILLALIVILLRFVTRPLSRVIARRQTSVRWKFEVAIAGISALFLMVSLFSFGAMDYMHAELHEIQDKMSTSPPHDVYTAVNDLEDTQHGTLFSMTPLLSLVGLLLAAVLGAAMAWSVIDPVKKMGQAMRRIAAGEFSETLEVENKDELGELAESVNQTSKELARLQEATLAEERARGLRERISQVYLAQEEERRRISRELHDGLGPSLAAIGNMIRASRLMVRSDPEGAERELEEITRSLKGRVQEIRELIHDLRPLALDQFGLVGALGQRVDRFGNETGVEAKFLSSGEIVLDPLAEVTIFRVVQECLSNVEKHAGAAKVDVNIRAGADGTEITVEDDGRGFDPDGVFSGKVEGGLGLVSMQERARLLGGTHSIESKPGYGCKVTLYIPSTEV